MSLKNDIDDTLFTIDLAFFFECIACSLDGLFLKQVMIVMTMKVCKVAAHNEVQVCLVWADDDVNANELDMSHRAAGSCERCCDTEEMKWIV